MRKVVNFLLGIFLFLVVILFATAGCISFRKSDKQLAKRMSERNIFYTINYDSFQSIRYRYLSYENTDTNAKLLLFIHGAPGSSADFLSYIENETLRAKYSIISIDRIGYGFTQYGKQGTVLQNSRLLLDLYQKMHKNRGTYFIGHSFGGPIALMATALSNDKNAHAIMIAPVVDPDNEKYFLFGKLVWWKSTRWLFSKALKVTGEEKYNHVKELKEAYDVFTIPAGTCLHIHGKKDNIAPFVNTEFTKKLIPGDKLTVIEDPEKGHLIPFKNMEFTIDTIINWIEKN